MGVNQPEVLGPGGNSNLGSAAADMVSAGMQLMQIRTEKQLLIAQLRPRDEKKFEQKLLAEAAAAGEDFFYSIPYKDHKEGCQDRRRCKCPVTYVEGPGVGLARSAARLWGNCSAETFPEQDGESAWQVRSVFVDFETNYMKSETKRVSKMKFLKGGRVVKAADRELDVIYQVGASKVERDCIIRALPKHIIDKAWELAKAAAAQEKAPVKEQIARLLRRFNEVDVRLAQIEAYLGCAFTEEALKAAEKNPLEVCAQLRGLLTAIKSGDVDVREHFPANGGTETPTGSSPSGGPSAGVTVDDVLHGQTRQEPSAKGSTPQPETKPASTTAALVTRIRSLLDQIAAVQGPTGADVAYQQTVGNRLLEELSAPELQAIIAKLEPAAKQPEGKSGEQRGLL